MVSTDGKVLGNIPGSVDVITLGLDIEIEPGSVDGSFDGSNDGKFGVLLLVDSLGYNDGKVIGSDEGIKM